MITAEIDPLRVEGKDLADRLKAAGVEVDYKNYRRRDARVLRDGGGARRAKAAQQAADGLKKGFGSRTSESASR